MPLDSGEQRAGERPADPRLPGEDVRIFALPARRGEHHTLAGLPHRHEQRLHLVHLGETARYRLAVDAAVGEREAGREARRADPHRLVDQLAHALDLLRGGGALVGGIPHDVEPQGGVPDVGGEVERRPSTLHQVEVFGKRLEVPGDPGRERVGVHAFDVLERVHDHVVMLRAARGDRETAVAGHHGSDPVIGGRLELWVPEHLGVEVGVDVDEAGCDGAARSVEVDRSVESRPDLLR